MYFETGIAYCCLSSCSQLPLRDSFPNQCQSRRWGENLVPYTKHFSIFHCFFQCSSFPFSKFICPSHNCLKTDFKRCEPTASFKNTCYLQQQKMQIVCYLDAEQQTFKSAGLTCAVALSWAISSMCVHS